MLKILAVSGYRSLLNLSLSLGSLNVITGANGSGKSNVYRALRLLAESASGRLIGSIAAEGGLQSALWAGPQARTETSQDPSPLDSMKSRPVRLQLGFASDEFSYAIDLGFAVPHQSAFAFDPIIKRECVWLGAKQSAATLCAERHGQIVNCRDKDGQWMQITSCMANHEGLMSRFGDPLAAPELILLRELMQRWRFYDHMRSDRDAPARQIQVGTYSPYLAHDGSNLAAVLQTIRESNNAQHLDETIDEAFPGCRLIIHEALGRFQILMEQPGMRRNLSIDELSEGTLRYLLLAAALLGKRTPELLVLNEPETHLHPQLLPALARLITRCAEMTQIIVVTHSAALASELTSQPSTVQLALEKREGSTRISGQHQPDASGWKWPKR